MTTSALTIDTAHLTDTGRVRPENQDACINLRGPDGEVLLIVADGMGGHQGGSTASRLLIETFCEYFDSKPQWDGEQLRDAISTANARIWQAANESIALSGMGTTAVAVLIGGGDDRAWVAHVGDSRAYRLRAGALVQLTKDHSAVAELVRHGAITPAEAAQHPRRNEILRSVGVTPKVEVDLSHFDLLAGDQVLLCTDGLTGVVGDDQIARIMSESAPVESVRILVAAANSGGGSDNVTVMVSAAALKNSGETAPLRRR